MVTLGIVNSLTFGYNSPNHINQLNTYLLRLVCLERLRNGTNFNGKEHSVSLASPNSTPSLRTNSNQGDDRF